MGGIPCLPPHGGFHLEMAGASASERIHIQ
jgi:hypothetical protein